MARTKVGLMLVKTPGATPVMVNYPLVGGTAYHEGNVMRVNGTTGSAMRAVAAGTSAIGVLASAVTQANATAGKYPIYLANSTNIFEAKMLVSSTPQIKVGDLADLAVATVSNHRLQGTASTNMFSIVGFNPDESLSAHTGVKYWVKFARSVWAETKSDSSK